MSKRIVVLVAGLLVAVMVFGPVSADVAGGTRVQGYVGGQPVISQDAATSATGATVSTKAILAGGGAAAGAGNLVAMTIKAGSTAPAFTDTSLVVSNRDPVTLQSSNGGNSTVPSLFGAATSTAGIAIGGGAAGGTGNLTQATVKAASTVPAATDTAVVTTQRDPLPAGTNVLGHVIADTGSKSSLTSPANPTISGGYSGALVDPLGWLRISAPSGLFVDPFDGSVVDVTDRWTSTVSGVGAAITQAAGALTVATTTTASAFANLKSKPTFLNSGGTALGFLSNIKFEAAPVTNVSRFWGWATLPGSPTFAAPITDGAGFELAGSVLTAVVWAAGVRTAVAVLTTPVDGLYHRYSVSRRTDLYAWYIDNLDTPVATSQFVTPAVQTLPFAFAMVNNSSVPSGSPTFLVSSSSVYENVPTNMQLSDGVFPWRQQTIKAPSTAAVATDSPAVVALHPSSPLPAPTLTKGTQGTTGFSTQDLKDAGRTSVMYTATVASTATAETLATLTRSVGLAATATCSSCSITAAKTFRMQSIAASARNSTGTVTGNVTIRIRAAVGGATTAASPLQQNYTVNIPASAASVVFPTMPIPDGFEIAAGAGNTWGLTITDPHWVTGTQVTTFDITIAGYEY